MPSKHWYGPTAPFPIDPGLLKHPKYNRLTDRAKLHLIELWMECWSGDGSGMVHTSQLYRRGPKAAEQLLNGWVEVTADPHTFYLHDYLEYHKPKPKPDVMDKIQLGATRSKVGGYGVHVRWHVNRGIVKLGCLHC